MYKLLKTNDIDVLTLQEAYVAASGPHSKISGCTLVTPQYHPKHGLASYICKDIQDEETVLNNDYNNAMIIKICEIYVANVY